MIRHRFFKSIALAGAFLAAGLASGFSATEVPRGYKLLYEQNFDQGPDKGESSPAASGFLMTDPKAWAISKEENGHALELVTQSKYNPAFRSPFNIALIKGKSFGDFVLEADLKQTGKEYGHRDMCLFFGFQDASHFYYVHMASKADDHAHNIFIVNDAPRLKIARTTTGGIHWGADLWHKVRLERKVSDGTVKVYFDDMTLPIMTAEDKTFGAGFIGFGSFDDTGKIDNIRIWGPELAPEHAPVKFESVKK
jgi:hypothetical protein